jgi:hypothetical protein
MPSDDPAKLKAGATYDAAADHFDDVPLSFWDRYDGRARLSRRYVRRHHLGVLDFLRPGHGKTGQGSLANVASERPTCRHDLGRMFEPGSTIWWTSVGRVRPDLVPTVNPWERITTPEAIANLMRDPKIENPEIVSMRGEQELASPEDWWTVVLGSGYRWTVDQMQPEEVE